MQYNGGEGYEAHPTLKSASASFFGGFLNAVVITTLNGIYSRVAVWLTDLENHRTGGAYEDALIRKTSLFHFFNQ